MAIASGDSETLAKSPILAGKQRERTELAVRSGEHATTVLWLRYDTRLGNNPANCLNITRTEKCPEHGRKICLLHRFVQTS